MIRRILTVILMLASAMAVSSCEKNEKTGWDYVVEIVDNINYRIANDENIAMKKNNDLIYVQGMESEDAARIDCSTWIYTEMKGDSYRFVLPDNKGTVTVSRMENEGEYFKVAFDLEGVERFMLQYVNYAMLSDDNFIPRPVAPPQTAL